MRVTIKFTDGETQLFTDINNVVRGGSDTILTGPTRKIRISNDYIVLIDENEEEANDEVPVGRKPVRKAV